MGLKKNFIFSTVLTASNYLFPFIIYPYVSRVLGVNNIGICNYVDGVINYAVLFSLMGLGVIGVREIAKVRDNRHRLNATFTSLLFLACSFTLVATCVLVTLTFTLDAFIPYRPLLVIGLLKLWGTILLIDWLYRGLEDFRYITIRTIAVKLCYLVSVFSLIHIPSDYIIYYLLTCLMVTVNSVINCFKARELVSLQFDPHCIKRLVRPFLILGCYLLLNSMYTTFNIIYLGASHGDTQVGYYTTATKIFSLILAVYTAYTTVVMPRASSLLCEGRHEEFRQLISKSVQGLILFSVPIALFGMIFANGVIWLVSGPGYGGAILPLRIVMPLIFIIGYEQILVVQTLTPLASDRVILLNSTIGATVGVIGNLLLVGRLASVGSAIVWMVAELCVLCCAQYFVSRKVGLHFPTRSLFTNVCAWLPYVALGISIQLWVPLGDIYKFLIGLAIFAIYLPLVQIKYLKNPVFTALIVRIKGLDLKNLSHHK